MTGFAVAGSGAATLLEKREFLRSLLSFSSPNKSKAFEAGSGGADATFLGAVGGARVVGTIAAGAETMEFIGFVD